MTTLPLQRSSSRLGVGEGIGGALQDVLHHIHNLQKDQTAQLLALDRLAKQVESLNISGGNEAEATPLVRQVSVDASDGPSDLVLPEDNEQEMPEKQVSPEHKEHIEELKRLAEEGVGSEDARSRKYNKLSRKTQRAIRFEFNDFFKEHRNLAQLFESDSEAELPFWQGLGQKIVEHWAFEKGIGLVIVINSLMLGIETELAIQDKPTAWPADLEYLFMAIYTMELILRIMAYGCAKCCRDGWFVFDACLVVVAYVGKIIPWILGAAGEGGVVDQIMVVRMLRILRFVRALRVVKQFGTVWKLIRGLLTSFDVMASAFVLVILMLYIFACLGMELIGGDQDLKDNPATARFAREDFRTVSHAIMTLFQFVTLDSTAAIYIPLINAKPELGVYFLVLLLAVGIALMNLVTASIVEASLQSSELDRQEKKDRLRQEMVRSIPVLMQLFHELDVDKSGKISLDEVEQFDINILPPVLRDNISADNMADLFGVLDVDGAGELDMKEFVGGLLQLWLMDVPITTLQILKFSRMNRTKTMEFFTGIMQRITEMNGVLNEMQGDLAKTTEVEDRF
eukprot:symbB.v1.2.022626.t1/scaffold2014.1/size92328/5